MVRDGKSLDREGGQDDGGVLKKRKRIRKKKIESNDDNVAVTSPAGERIEVGRWRLVVLLLTVISMHEGDKNKAKKQSNAVGVSKSKELGPMHGKNLKASARDDEGHYEHEDEEEEEEEDEPAKKTKKPKATHIDSEAKDDVKLPSDGVERMQASVSGIMSSSEFSSLNLSDNTSKAITEQGFQYMTEVQARTIPALLTGRDVLGAAR
jgi:hypothetical protein